MVDVRVRRATSPCTWASDGVSSHTTAATPTTPITAPADAVDALGLALGDGDLELVADEQADGLAEEGPGDEQRRRP